MVYGIAFCPINKQNQLKEMGFADSKTLNHIEREEYRLQIEQSDIMGWQVDVIMPQYLSGRMLRHNKYNLNFISHDSAIALVYNTIARGFNIQQVYVDTVGDPVKYEAKLKAIFPSIQIIVAKKADSLYPIVSAASICAKVSLKNMKKIFIIIPKRKVQKDKFVK